MKRTIAVKGTGTVEAAPDQIELTMNLSTLDPDYRTAAEEADKKSGKLSGAVRDAGFSPEALKTTDWGVGTEYRGVHDPATGEYRQEFAGYRIRHGLLLSFPLDLGRLAELLGLIGDSGAEPELSIRFTLKDPEALRKKALESAAANAREKAEILAAASGVRLGELLTVRYDFADVRFASPTMFEADAQTMNAGRGRMMAKASFAADMTPQDITFTDNAGFVWEIL